MCGFAGIVSLKDLPSEAELRKAGDFIRHRGPDHQGIFSDADSKVAFVHQRLAIIDLDSRANQPFFSPDDRYCMVFNGEIYNYKELRKDLERSGVEFRSDSDTEVLLQLFIRDGKDCLSQLNGMFAFAIWDKEQKSLFIARDRMGIKPLYIYRTEELIAFTSDLKAFQAWPQVNKVINQRAVWNFLAFGNVPNNDSIYEGIFKFQPGTYLQTGIRQANAPEEWWSQQIATSPENLPTEQLKELLKDSIDKRMLSDVEVGAFASGGLDSSGILSFLPKEQLQTFTIGFAHQSNTLDLQRSKELSKSMGLRQTITMLGEDSLGDFNHFMEIMDEPISEASILPLLHNYRIAKEHGVKVILSGDGADEVWGGYSYFHTLAWYRKWNKWVPNSIWNASENLSRALLSGLKANSKPGKFRDLYLLNSLQLLGQKDHNRCHQLIASQNNQKDLNLLANGKNIHFEDIFMMASYNNVSIDWNQVLKIETRTTLMNKHLAKVDKASMANSVEARVPYLDHRIVELAGRASAANRTDKSLLKKALKGQVPESIINDRKRGFNLPLKAWVREYIAKEGATYLDRQSLEALGILSMPALDHLIKSHRKGYQDHSRTLWSLYVLSRWLKHNEWQLS